jgi:hypothetical protein
MESKAKMLIKQIFELEDKFLISGLIENHDDFIKRSYWKCFINDDFQFELLINGENIPKKINLNTIYRVLESNDNKLSKIKSIIIEKSKIELFIN